MLILVSGRRRGRQPRRSLPRNVAYYGPIESDFAPALPWALGTLENSCRNCFVMAARPIAASQQNFIWPTPVTIQGGPQFGFHRPWQLGAAFVPRSLKIPICQLWLKRSGRQTEPMPAALRNIRKRRIWRDQNSPLRGRHPQGLTTTNIPPDPRRRTPFYQGQVKSGNEFEDANSERPRLAPLRCRIRPSKGGGTSVTHPSRSRRAKQAILSGLVYTSNAAAPRVTLGTPAVVFTSPRASEKGFSRFLAL